MPKPPEQITRKPRATKAWAGFSDGKLYTVTVDTIVNDSLPRAFGPALFYRKREARARFPGRAPRRDQGGAPCQSQAIMASNSTPKNPGKSRARVGRPLDFARFPAVF